MSELMAGFRLVDHARRLRLRSTCPRPPLLVCHGRDDSGSTATPDRTSTGVVTAPIHVVGPPRDKCRSEPVLGMGRSDALRSRGGRPTSSPDDNVAKSRNGSRLSHPFQEERCT